MPCSACAKSKAAIANQPKPKPQNAPRQSPVVTNPPTQPTTKKFPPKVISELPPIR